MQRIILGWLLALLEGWQQGQAQQLGWEKPLSYTAGANIFGYQQPLAGGDYLVSGIGALMGGGFPFIYARRQPGGTLVYQRTGAHSLRWSRG